MPKGGFWVTNGGLGYEPKRQFRFRVEIAGMALEDNASGDSYDDKPDDQDGTILWYIKTVDKPSVSLASYEAEEVNFGMDNPTPRAAGPIWKPVTMTFVDPQYPNVTRKLMRLLRRAGYMDEEAQGINASNQFEHAFLKGSVGDVKIHQLDALGDILETWDLVDAWPSEINFGKLDYSSDDFVEISVTWAYSYAKLTTFGASGLDSGTAMQGDLYDDQMKERTFIYQRDGVAPTGKKGVSGEPPTTTANRPIPAPKGATGGK